MTMITILLTSVMMLACGAPLPALTTATAQRDNFRERDEFNQTYQLAPGARVEVSSIRGPVEIVNGDGATAVVQIIRSARTRADLEYHKIAVEQTATALSCVVCRSLSSAAGKTFKWTTTSGSSCLEGSISLLAVSVAGSKSAT